MPSGRSLHTTCRHGSHETSCTWSPSKTILQVCWEGNTSTTMLCYSKHYILEAYGFKCHFSFSFTTFLQEELEFINKLRLYSKHLLWHLDCILNESVLRFAIFVAFAIIIVHCKWFFVVNKTKIFYKKTISVFLLTMNTNFFLCSWFFKELNESSVNK